MKNLDYKIKYWVDISDYDIKTAIAMLESKRYLYVGFMCHQTIEKILKAYYVLRKKVTPPYTHNLTKLAELSSLLDDFSNEQKKFLSYLQPMNIEARYPKYKDSIFKSLNKIKCRLILNDTKKLQQWIKKKLL